ncbi:hypothetical protein NUU61_005392 [Penicillium alfredii]|uniref:DNA ligase D 3'-phosphoesterase domain-containing protein n=1 Tax=Penicillium alfredii TaxID=1506179 RepID=A0A9W9F9D8_9EURO|nr:uncharacterized protein NUU61_005392 [Penicillium alfredii]KAJ5096036.1 hypothetical protein NUU61_005392 [Penicillium alfredii]
MKRTRNPESNEELDETRTKQSTSILSSLIAPVSPPRRKSTFNGNREPNRALPSGAINLENTPSLAAIEAGQVEVTDHLSIVSTKLRQYMRFHSYPQPTPRIPIEQWVELYRRNEHPEGRHFVIHQHDHPLAGPHYDLRLQFSESSSVSWSVMYGLPGDPNSHKLNRNATETRVHCLWVSRVSGHSFVSNVYANYQNHLIETASSKTGSMIIWDTGEYEILPYELDQSLPETDDSRSEVSDEPASPIEQISDSARLREAFRNRKIRLRLHGTRLPQNYTLVLRMDKSMDFAKPLRDGPKRRRRLRPQQTATQTPSTSDSESPSLSDQPALRPSLNPTEVDKSTAGLKSESEQGTHSDDIDQQIQKNNAYPGSSNTIGSIHQRRWYLSLDRLNSGFEMSSDARNDGQRSKKRWTRTSDGDQGLLGFKPFHVLGPESERSIVTGRRGVDVLNDEGVRDFVPRRGWRPVLR